MKTEVQILTRRVEQECEAATNAQSADEARHHVTRAQIAYEQVVKMAPGIEGYMSLANDLEQAWENSCALAAAEKNSARDKAPRDPIARYAAIKGDESIPIGQRMAAHNAAYDAINPANYENETRSANDEQRDEAEESYNNLALATPPEPRVFFLSIHENPADTQSSQAFLFERAADNWYDAVIDGPFPGGQRAAEEWVEAYGERAFDILPNIRHKEGQCELKWIEPSRVRDHRPTPDTNPSIGTVRCRYRLNKDMLYPAGVEYSQAYQICAHHAEQMKVLSDWEWVEGPNYPPVLGLEVGEACPCGGSHFKDEHEKYQPGSLTDDVERILDK